MQFAIIKSDCGEHFTEGITTSLYYMHILKIFLQANINLIIYPKTGWIIIQYAFYHCLITACLTTFGFFKLWYKLCFYSTGEYEYKLTDYYISEIDIQLN